MKLTVLGCSGSVTPEAGTCSFLVGERVVVEMGSAASALTLEAQAGIDDIFLTHAHLDHVKDLAFFAENVYALRRRPVRVHAQPETLERIAAHLLNGVIWPDFSRLPTLDNPTLRYAPLEPGSSVEVPGLRITPIEVEHPGGCVAYLLDSGDGILVLSGDTGPTEALWDAVNAAGDRVRGVIIETSFPNRLRDLADISGHLTPELLGGELEKLERKDLPIYVHHIKAPTHAETLADLATLADPRIQVLEQGVALAF